VSAKCPQQQYDDCGIFMLSNLRYRLNDEEVDGVSAPQRGCGLARSVAVLHKCMASEIVAQALERWL
jgi:Ulp1 family protease